jgi:hypothetical protein
LIKILKIRSNGQKCPLEMLFFLESLVVIEQFRNMPKTFGEIIRGVFILIRNIEPVKLPDPSKTESKR